MLQNQIGGCLGMLELTVFVSLLGLHDSEKSSLISEASMVNTVAGSTIVADTITVVSFIISRFRVGLIT